MTSQGRVMAVDCEARGDTFVPRKPRMWSETPIYMNNNNWSNFDVAPDGKRVVAFPAPEEESKGSVHLTFLMNFFDEVKRRLP